MRAFGIFAVLLAPLAAQEAPSFARDVAPLFAARCSGCHAGGVKMGSLNLDSYEGVMQGGTHGKIVVPGKSAESRLYLMMAGKMKPAMPMDGTTLASGETELIRRWIDGGARPPTAEEAAALAKAASPKIPEIKPAAPVKPQIFSLAWHPEGKFLALGGFEEVRLADAASGKTIHTLKSHAETVRGLAVSGDGRWLAAAGGLPGRKGEVKLWDAVGRTLVRTMEGHADCIYAVAFSPDGKWLATASYDKLIKLWDVDTGKEVRTLKDHIDAVYALAFTPEGRLVSGAADRTIKIWDPATGQRIYTLSEPLDGISTIALHPGGKMVAAGGLDKTIRVWTLGAKSGSLVNSLIAHEDAILGLAWSPDGKTLVSSSADRTVKVFRAEDLTEIKALADQPDWVHALEFSPDGKALAAGRHDGTLRLYDTDELLGSPAVRRAAN